MADNAQENPEQIKISVIIPTYNRAQRLRNCLAALAHQSQPPQDFEVIVVIDGATDDTQQAAEALDLPYALRMIWQEKQGQSFALNRGAQVSRGIYILFLDDDMLADPQLIAEHLRAQEAYRGCVGLGQIKLKSISNPDWFATFYEAGWAAQYDTLNQTSEALGWENCYSGNLSLPRTLFFAVGQFTTDLKAGYDVELGYKLHKQGARFVYLPNASSLHDDYKDFKALARYTVHHGAAIPDICDHHPELRPTLLGTFYDFAILEVLLRKLLLRLKPPLRLIDAIGTVAGRGRIGRCWFRLINRYLFWAGIKHGLNDQERWRRMTSGTLVLMYHAFTEGRRTESPYVLPIRSFTRQLKLLKWLGYQVIDLEQYFEYRQAYEFPPAGAVVVTMDDGYADNYRLAGPVLQRFGFAATIFLVSDYIGDQNRWDGEGGLAGRPLLGWAEIETLVGQGISFGAHTRSHPDLTQLSPQQAQAEISGSKAVLEAQSGRTVKLFAYPYGAVDVSINAQVEAAGFIGGCTIEPGFNTATTPPHHLRRIEIYGSDSLLRFFLKLVSGGQKLIPRPAWLQRQPIHSSEVTELPEDGATNHI